MSKRVCVLCMISRVELCGLASGNCRNMVMLSYTTRSGVIDTRVME